MTVLLYGPRCRLAFTATIKRNFAEGGQGCDIGYNSDLRVWLTYLAQKVIASSILLKMFECFFFNFYD